MFSLTFQQSPDGTNSLLNGGPDGNTLISSTIDGVTTNYSYPHFGIPSNWTGNRTLTWCNGRTLASIGSTSFTYDGEGQRITKTTGGVTTEYIYEGDKLVMQKQGNTALFFLYDTSGLFGFDHIVNGSTEGTYYYRIDGKGEIIALTNSAGEVVANYIYDAWGFPTDITDASGNTITSSTHIGIVNPIRYKGYCYDTETELYYLNSRYYDPEICRFVNADNQLTTGSDLTGLNLFAYCGNNPVNRVDPTGQFWKELWDAFNQTLQQASGYFAAAAGVSQVDTPVPGPADVVSGVLLLGGILVCAGIATYTTIAIQTPSISTPKVKEKAKAISASTPSSTVIYRYGGTNPGNLTPKSKDKYSGLSFSTVPMPGAAVTTIEALNSTGVVYAVRDGLTHVSVRPVGATMEDWISAGSGSIWTRAVKSVVVKWDGVN